MTTIANAILQNAKKLPVSLLNWDGTGGKDDVLFNLKDYVHRYTGHNLLRVRMEGDVLDVAEPNSQLLKLDVRTGKEIYGRVRHLGITFEMMEELRQNLL